MKVYISYEASYCNSFLSGDNNTQSVEFSDKHNKWVKSKNHDRKYICTSTALKNKDNFIKSEVTHNTVMGLLNLLIGDQRKLWQSRLLEDYFFKDIENSVSFEINNTVITNEIVYLNNKDRAQDQSRLLSVEAQDVCDIFIGEYANELWSILYMTIDELKQYILNDIHVIRTVDHTSAAILDRINVLEKPVVIVDDDIRKIYETIPDIVNVDDLKEKININRLYFIGLKKKARELILNNVNSPIQQFLTRAGEIAGLYIKLPLINQFKIKTGLTGTTRTVKGNPYRLSTVNKNMTMSDYMLTKKDGQLIINIDVDDETEQRIKDAIEAAGVSTFYVGKKGLAYVDAIV